MLDITQHPCFNEEAKHKFARIHLPVAAKCNIQCNYCNRKYDCVNESRPGVTSTLLSPQKALEYLNKAVSLNPEIKVVGIAGPGDPFATPEETLETLRLVREQYPDMLLCVATNGLVVAKYAQELAKLKVSHVTITVNAIGQNVGALIYSWVRDGKMIYRGKLAARTLIKHQLEAVQAISQAGITVKVNSIIIPGINDQHIKEVARRVAESGASLFNAIPLFPTQETIFEYIKEPDAAMVKRIRDSSVRFIPQMQHCARCRADAVGLLGQDDQKILEVLHGMNTPARNFSKQKPMVAVASMEGYLINQHLGEANHLWIYGQDGAAVKLMDKRKLPLPGGGRERWEQVADIIKDCSYLLVSGVGGSPGKVFAEKGIEVIETEGLIHSSLDYLFGLAQGKLLKKQKPTRCGESCAGNGMGCM